MMTRLASEEEKEAPTELFDRAQPVVFICIFLLFLIPSDTATGSNRLEHFFFQQKPFFYHWLNRLTLNLALASIFIPFLQLRCCENVASSYRFPK